MMLTNSLLESIIELVEGVALEALSVWGIRDDGELTREWCARL